VEKATGQVEIDLFLRQTLKKRKKPENQGFKNPLLMFR
jgi:hypothetical protein